MLNQVSPLDMPKINPAYADLYEGLSRCYDMVDKGDNAKCKAAYEELQVKANKWRIAAGLGRADPGIIDNLAGVALVDVLGTRRFVNFVEPMDFHE